MLCFTWSSWPLCVSMADWIAFQTICFLIILSTIMWCFSESFAFSFSHLCEQPFLLFTNFAFAAWSGHRARHSLYLLSLPSLWFLMRTDFGITDCGSHQGLSGVGQVSLFAVFVRSLAALTSYVHPAASYRAWCLPWHWREKNVFRKF